MSVSTPPVLWTPTPEQVEQTTLTRFTRWLEAREGRRFDTYADLWQWSIDDVDAFWASIWEFFDVRAAEPYERVLGRREMPGAEWFPGARLNYAEHVFRGKEDAAVAGSSGLAKPDSNATRIKRTHGCDQPCAVARLARYFSQGGPGYRRDASSQTRTSRPKREAANTARYRPKRRNQERRAGRLGEVQRRRGIWACGGRTWKSDSSSVTRPNNSQILACR